MTKRYPHLTRLVIDGLAAALVHAETMMGPDPETFGREDWKRQAAAERWVRGVIERRGLTWEESEEKKLAGGGE